MSRPSIGLTFVTLIAVGVAQSCTSSQPSNTEPRDVTNTPATVRDIATDSLDPSDAADTEPSIAVNPANEKDIAIVAFSEPWGPTQKAPIWRSFDGGTT